MAALALCLAGGLQAQQIVRSESSEDLITVDFKDTPVRKIISDVAEVFGVHVVIPDSLQGTTSVKFRNVTWEQIFEISLSPLGYDFVERPGRVEIMTREEVEALPIEEVRVEIFFQKPDELAEFFQRKLGTAFGLSFKPVENTIVFQAHPKRAQMVRDWIARVDTPEYRLNPFPHPVWFPDHVPSLGRDAERDSVEDDDDWSGGMTSEVFVIEWVDAEKVKEIVLREMPKLPNVNVAWSNALVVSGNHAKMHYVEALIKYLDDKRWYTPPEKRGEP